MTAPKKTPKTLYEKVWESHVVHQEPKRPAILYIDLHLVHEVTSPQAFAGLKRRGLPVANPGRTLATMDHSTPTAPGGLSLADAKARFQLQTLVENCREHGIELLEFGSEFNGIVHVVAPELGRTQPGMTIVCGDSHTSTHGAFGSLAFGIGTSEVEQVLATQALLQTRAKPFEVRFEGTLQPGVSAKDMALAMIATLGTGGGTGRVFEYTGAAVRALDMEGRMTLCNMSIEAGARASMVAPDDVTFDYLRGRTGAPQGADFDAAVARWRSLCTDPGAVYDGVVIIDASAIEPMITWGTNPAMAGPIHARVPDPSDTNDPATKHALEAAIRYMGITPGRPLAGHPIDVVFVGSCTNSRLSDLREAADVLRGRRVADRVTMLVVPGSQAVRRQAEAEGLHEVFLAAGAQWRGPGCSMCIAMNGDKLQPGQVSVSTSNRNFEGRQGAGGRTLLASPRTAAASAVAGEVTDPRNLEAA